MAAASSHLEDAFDRLRLARTRRIGPVTYAQLIARFGTARRAIDALPDVVARAGGKPFQLADPAMIHAEVDKVAALNGRYVFIGSPGYPPLLAQLANAPVVLIAKGDMDLASRPAIAIVGARNASAAACRFARVLADGLGRRGFVITSGLARGIDAAAHQGALAHGTIGVIASGLDVSFPPENAALQAQLADQHLVLTEYPPGTEPLARQFPHRNRIIAGSTLGTVVVEAAPRSGSLLTARMAAEAGRDVMAVPGSPLDPRAQGCNGLIRDGATLVQSVDDIVEALGTIDPRMVRAPQASGFHVGQDGAETSDAARDAILSLLGPTPTGGDDLIRQSGLTSADVALALLDLELAGFVERHAANRFTRVYPS